MGWGWEAQLAEAEGGLPLGAGGLAAGMPQVLPIVAMVFERLSIALCH